MARAHIIKGALTGLIDIRWLRMRPIEFYSSGYSCERKRLLSVRNFPLANRRTRGIRVCQCSTLAPLLGSCWSQYVTCNRFLASPFRLSMSLPSQLNDFISIESQSWICTRSGWSTSLSEAGNSPLPKTWAAFNFELPLESTKRPYSKHHCEQIANAKLANTE